MSSALTRRSMKIVKHWTTTELPVKIRELRKSLSEGTSLLQAAEKEYSRRRKAEEYKKSLREKMTMEKSNGDQPE